MTMRFGVFIPQGWRTDMVGIDPAQHWSTMSTLAKRADSGPWESIWVYDHFHTTTRVVGADGDERELAGYGNLPGVGTPEQIIEKLSALKAAGMSYAVTYFPVAADDTSGIELFEKQVIPALQ